MNQKSIETATPSQTLAHSERHEHQVITSQAPATSELVSLAPGTRWFFEGVEVEILAVPNLREVLVRKLATHETIQVLREALSQPPTPAQAVDARQAIEEASDEELAFALKAQAALDPYAGGKVLDEQTAVQLAKEFNTSTRSLRRWLKEYKLQRHLAAFLNQAPGPDKGTSKLTDEVIAIVDASVKAQLGLAGGVTVTSVLDEIKTKCETIGVPTPAESSIQRRINTAKRNPNNYPPALRDQVRARIDLIKGSLTPSEVLEYVQIDHTVMDVLVRDPFSRKIIGRPLITVAFEVATRVVLGFVLSLEAPSQLSTALCLHHAVFPKEAWLKRIGAEGPWPFFGTMKKIHTDLAAEFVSPWFHRGGKRYGIDILHRRGGEPQDGGHIERFLGTLATRLHLLPGTTFVQALKKKTSKSMPIFTLASLTTWTANEIVAYMSEPHGGLKKRSPAHAWEQAFTTKQGLILPSYPKNEKEFLTSFLPADSRVVTREGIEWNGLRYRSEALQPFVEPGVRKPFRFDKRDISGIYFEPPKGEHIWIPWTNCNWDPISLWEWNEIRVRSGQRARQTDQETIRRARAANRALIEREAKTSQRARRRLAREAEWEAAQRSNEALATDRKLKSVSISINSRARFEVLE